MANDAHVTLSCTGHPLNPEKQMDTSIRKPLVNAGNLIKPKIPRAHPAMKCNPNFFFTPPIGTGKSNPVVRAPRKNLRDLMVKKLRDLREKNGSLKSGEQVMKSYILMLESEIKGQAIYVGDTCLLLDPLLRTHKSSVLGCFINHQGLRILHAMLRRFCQPELIEGRSVLRKVLRVLQHLEECEMLTEKHMTCHPPGFCVHKFCKLLFKLAEDHEDSEVRTLGCSFQGLRFCVWIQAHPAHEKCWWWDDVLAS